MSAMISDILVGHLSPQVANAVTNAAGKMLKVYELRQKYGSTQEPQPDIALI